MAVRKGDLIALNFEDLDASMRSKLLKKLAGGWPTNQTKEAAKQHAAGGQQAAGGQTQAAKQHAAGGQQAAGGQTQAERLAEAVLHACRLTASEKDLPSLVGCSEIVFADSDGDIMRQNERGVMRLNDTIYRMAGSTFALLRQVLQDFCFEVSASGLAQLLATLWQLSDQPRQAEQFQRSIYFLLFGGEVSVQDMTYTERFTSHMIWMGMMGGCLSYNSTWLYYLHHLGLPPLERAWRSAPRTMAFVELALQQTMDATHCWRKRRVMWLIGATDAVEGKQAREGLFEDLYAFREQYKVSVHLIGENLETDLGAPSSRSVEVHGHHYREIVEARVPKPTLIFFLHAGLGTFDLSIGESLNFIVGMALFSENPPVVVTSSRSEAEGRYEIALLYTCGVAVSLPTRDKAPVRNLFSGMAGHPDIEYDDNGWWVAYCGSYLPAELRPGHMEWIQNNLEDVFSKARALVEPSAPEAPAQEEAAVAAEAASTEAPLARQASEEAAAAAAAEEPVQVEAQVAEAAKHASKSPAVFWGILDLKYDPRRPAGDRVKVLETGDGRTSKFSGYGASIKETFQQENRLEETLHRSVLTENKKLTHDTILDSGYGHLRPRQIPFAKVYKPDLAESIVAAFGFSESDSCVLKLCNRTRGAGVVPVRVAELDNMLQMMLQPPDKVEAWLKEQPEDWARSVTSGCTEEQLRHWWSNECPLFVVEELIFSMPTEKDGHQLDGTMRVGFSLHREERRVKLEPVYAGGAPGHEESGGSDTEEAQAQGNRMRRDVMQEAAKVWDKDRPYMDLFRPDSTILRVQWLGGYWKLPIEDIWSEDLRAKVVSVAKQGTAPVSSLMLHEVYAAMGFMVPRLFEAKDMSNSSLLRRYSEFPEFAAFAVSRLACSMRGRDRMKCHGLLALAKNHLSKCYGATKDLVESYIVRNFGVHHALQGSWQSAQDEFSRALRLMPCNATARFLLGIAQMEMGRVEAAISSMEDSLLLDPDFKAPYACLGMLRLRKGEYQKAADISRAGLARHPYTPQCSYNLGLSSFALACQREETFTTLRTAAAKLPPATAAMVGAAQGQLQAKPGPAPKIRPLTLEGRYEVAHSRVLVRAAPSRTAKVVGIVMRGRPMYATPNEVDGQAWLCIKKKVCEELNVQASEAWLLMNGKYIGLGPLLVESTVPSGTEVVVKVRHEEKEGILQLRLTMGTTIAEVRQRIATELGKPKFTLPLHRKVGTEFWKCEDEEPLGPCVELLVRGKAQWSLPKLPRQEVAPPPPSSEAQQVAQGQASPQKLVLRSEALADPLLQRLREASLESLETARTSRTRDLLWTERDDRLLARLREPGLLEWPKEELPRDGWRVLNYRP